MVRFIFLLFLLSIHAAQYHKKTSLGSRPQISRRPDQTPSNESERSDGKYGILFDLQTDIY